MLSCFHCPETRFQIDTTLSADKVYLWFSNEFFWFLLPSTDFKSVYEKRILL